MGGWDPMRSHLYVHLHECMQPAVYLGHYFGLTWCRCKQRWFTRCSTCYREIKPVGKEEEENLAVAIAAKELGE